MQHKSAMASILNILECSPCKIFCDLFKINYTMCDTKNKSDGRKEHFGMFIHFTFSLLEIISA